MGIKLDRWTKEEETRLLNLVDQKVPMSRIASILSKEFFHPRNPRTHDAVKAHYHKLSRINNVKNKNCL